MKKILATLLAVSLLLVMVAACGGNANTGTPDSGTPDSGTGTTDSGTADGGTTDSGTGDAGFPDPNNILRFATTGIAGNFNPILANNVYDQYVVSLIFEGMISNDASGTFIPHIATWEVSSDHLTYTFTLEDSITFSDGTPLTAEDVAFTYTTIASPEYIGPRGYAVASLKGYPEFRAGDTDTFEGVEVIDEKTVAFHIADGAESPANIQFFGFGILPKHIYDVATWDDFTALNTSPVGSGWFVMEEYRDKEFVLLHRNNDYWNTSEKPILDGILMSEIPEESLQGAFMTGQLDLAQPQTSSDNWDAYSVMDGVFVQSHLANGYTYLQFNTLTPQLEDYRVRQALMYSLDRQAFIEALFGTLGSVGLAPISPVSWAFPTSGLNDYAFDMDRASALMDDAGWEMGADGVRTKGGNRMELKWLVYDDVAWPGVLSALAADSWRELGVDLSIDIMDFETVQALTGGVPIEERDFSIYTMGWSTAIDPDLTGGIFGMEDDTMDQGGFNQSGWFRQDVHDKMLEALREFDQGRRAELYKELALIFNEQLPTAVVSYRYFVWVNSDRVQGLDIGPFVDWTYHVNKISLAN
ncbi:MAG: ABC transporter substrate-binding protein [Oscillospiraceae bacterium]|nr:ABC transporter substrate-binding protein [Oscillospiraceae bacterium]